MRDFLLLAILLPGIPLALFRPWIGILYWFWMGLMNPHEMAWGLVSQMRPALLIGIATLVGLIFTRDKKGFFPDSLSKLMLLFCVHFTITTLTAFYPDDAWVKWQKVSKVFLISFVTISLFRYPKRLHYLIWVVTLSLGFIGIKGGLFGLRTAGQYRFYGVGGFIGDNTSVALALVMILPFLFFLGIEQKKKLYKYFLLCSFLLTIIAIITTDSRGGLVGLIVVIFMILFSSKKKFAAWSLIALCIVGALLFAPEQWFERMETIQTYEEDESSMQRIQTWKFAIILASHHPFTGGGFETFVPELMLKYTPWMTDFHDAHSIYFEVLAEQGFVGLGIFLGIIVTAFLALRRIRRIASLHPQLSWASTYAAIFQCSIVGYLSCGAFLGLADFDLFWLIIAMTVCLKLIVQDHAQGLSVEYLDANTGVLPEKAVSFKPT